MADQERCEALIKEDLGLYIDFSRQRMTMETVQVREAAVGGARHLLPWVSAC
jgi:hypothetical protein